MIYNVKRSDSKICGIDCALQKGDVLALKQIVKEQKDARKNMRVLCCNIDEVKYTKNLEKHLRLTQISTQTYLSSHVCPALCYAIKVIVRW